MSLNPHHDPKEAFEFLLSHGALRYGKNGEVTHLPCSLTPWDAPADFVAETEALTALYSELYHRVAQDDDFLKTELEVARRADPFVAHLFQAWEKERPGKPALYLNRNDCMPGFDSSSGVWPKQVEMNLMASALGEASSIVYRMHRFLAQHESWRMPENYPGIGLAEALAEAYRVLGSDGVVLFLIPVGEVSVFDQRLLEARLVEQHGVPTLRTTLEELGEQGEMRGGDLYFRGRKISIAYFRTGYAPYHYTAPATWTARELLESSSAISVPCARTQLANTKLVQLILSKVEALERFVEADVARRLVRSCVDFTRLEEPWGQYGSGVEAAQAEPDNWVLKPYREGGGNNFFSEGMLERLAVLTEEEKRAYVLMEKIRQPVFDSVRMVDREVIPCRCVTELGYFGTAFYPEPSGPAQFNRSCGYLLRTKDESTDEGLVLGGFSFLDAVRLGES